MRLGHGPLQSLEKSMVDIDAMRKRLDELEARFQSYDGGDRPQSPPMDLLRDILKLRAKLASAEIESGKATTKEAS